MRTKRMIAVVALIVLLGVTGQAKTEHVITTFDVPGGTYTDAGAINDAGQIVGDFIDANGVLHGYVKIGSFFTSIDVPSATGTLATGINAAGQVVGFIA